MQKIITIISAIIVFATTSSMPTIAEAKTNKNLKTVNVLENRLDKSKTIVFKANYGLDKEKIAKKREDKKAKVAKAEENVNKVKQNLDQAKAPDTTGFDKIYKAASKQYGVPWEVLSGIHYIETHRSGDTEIASYAGAMGPMQFIPSTWAMYGVDGDGDGQANINDVDDAIFSAANYLAASGAADGDVYRAIYAYNHADWYVNQVLEQARMVGYNA